MVWRLLNFFLTPSQRLERCMSIVTSMTTGVSEREANDALNAYVSIILSLNPFLLLWKLLDMIRKMERLQCLGARGWSSCLGLLNQASQLLSVFPNLGVPSLGALKVKVKLLSCVRLFAAPWTVAYEVPPSMEFSRQEYWSGLPFPFWCNFPKSFAYTVCLISKPGLSLSENLASGWSLATHSHVSSETKLLESRNYIGCVSQCTLHVQASAGTFCMYKLHLHQWFFGWLE